MDQRIPKLLPSDLTHLPTVQQQHSDVGRRWSARQAYVRFIGRFQIFYSNIKNYDITKGRPNLQKFIEPEWSNTRDAVEVIDKTMGLSQNNHLILYTMRCSYDLHYHLAAYT
ncbi:hypothetical protein SEVIR_4G130850v4 [Setaria viridis]